MKTIPLQSLLMVYMYHTTYIVLYLYYIQLNSSYIILDTYSINISSEAIVDDSFVKQGYAMRTMVRCFRFHNRKAFDHCDVCHMIYVTKIVLCVGRAELLTVYCLFKLNMNLIECFKIRFIQFHVSMHGFELK